jgi:biotin-(acetyl-CoA carboxylase) ligase
MPGEARTRIREKYAGEIDLPPLFRLVTLREAGDAFVHAQQIAAKSGAGTLVWVRRFDLVEFAVVLEPEEPLASARRVLYAGMSALVDALSFHAPPETLIAIEWPDAILVDGGVVGGARLAWPKNADEKAPPSWLVFGAMIRTAILSPDEPGIRPQAAALDEEGFDDLGSGQLLSTFARHFMSSINTWQQDGFRPIMENYLAYLPADEQLERTIDGTGDLLIRQKGKTQVEKRRLLPAIEPVAWFDPETGSPRL